GKTDGVADYTITSVENTGGTTSATMAMKYVDAKGKEIVNSDYKMTCTPDGINIDFNSLMPSQMMQQYQDMGMEMDISGTDIVLPNDLTVGEQLADANVSITMSMKGMNMSIVVDMVDRKVDAQENVTTPAGNFECYVISEVNKTQFMGVNQEMPAKLWLSEGVGMVKQETYKKNGDLMTRMELTKLTE
ncbi:MAG: DUF3108 domain-containing protein, partial [Maribacter sp.]|nr:DUF3108 domain-containing protein [Maribacter sp.]